MESLQKSVLASAGLIREAREALLCKLGHLQSLRTALSTLTASRPLPVHQSQQYLSLCSLYSQLSKQCHDQQVVVSRQEQRDIAGDNLKESKERLMKLEEQLEIEVRVKSEEEAILRGQAIVMQNEKDYDCEESRRYLLASIEAMSRQDESITMRIALLRMNLQLLQRKKIERASKPEKNARLLRERIRIQGNQLDELVAKQKAQRVKEALREIRNQREAILSRKVVALDSKEVPSLQQEIQSVKREMSRDRMKHQQQLVKQEQALAESKAIQKQLKKEKGNLLRQIRQKSLENHRLQTVEPCSSQRESPKESHGKTKHHKKSTKRQTHHYVSSPYLPSSSSHNYSARWIAAVLVFILVISALPLLCS